MGVCRPLSPHLPIVLSTGRCQLPHRPVPRLPGIRESIFCFKLVHITVRLVFPSVAPVGFLLQFGFHLFISCQSLSCRSVLQCAIRRMDLKGFEISPFLQWQNRHLQIQGSSVRFQTRDFIHHFAQNWDLLNRSWPYTAKSVPI